MGTFSLSNALPSDTYKATMMNSAGSSILWGAASGASFSLFNPLGNKTVNVYSIVYAAAVTLPIRLYKTVTDPAFSGHMQYVNMLGQSSLVNASYATAQAAADGTFFLGLYGYGSYFPTEMLQGVEYIPILPGSGLEVYFGSQGTSGGAFRLDISTIEF